MNYFISAGEASGDIHAAALIRALREVDPHARFTFLGGDLMAAEAGHAPLIHYRDMAFMGFIEVARHLSKVLGNLSTARRALRSEHPDALILVDYPSFNLKLAKTAASLGIPVYYYISPKVWAWKEYRVKSIRRLVRNLFSILPFEVQFYARHDYPITYVGNPSVEEVDARLEALTSPRQTFCHDHNLPSSSRIIALVPGSRRAEIRDNLPVMVEAAQRFTEYTPVIAGAPGIEREYYDKFAGNVPVIMGATFELVAASVAALVTSGTATLETALIGTPQVVLYRNNGSRIIYTLGRPLIRTPWVSLPNLIAGRPVVSELLFHRCTPDNVADELQAILPGGDRRNEMIDGYNDMRRLLGNSSAAKVTARAIFDDLIDMQHQSAEITPRLIN